MIDDVPDCPHERIEQFLFGHRSGDFPLDKYLTLSRSAGNAHIGFARFPGPVDRTSHDRNLERALNGGSHLLDSARQPRHVDFRAPAGGTGYDGHAGCKAQRFEDFLSRERLVERIAGERHPDRVADSPRQQRTQSDARSDCAGSNGARLGDADMLGVVGS